MKILTLFYSFFLLIFSLYTLQASQTQEDIERNARHLVRPIVYDNYMATARKKALQEYPDDRRENDENLNPQTLFLINAKGDLKIYLFSNVFVDRLNNNIVLCLKGEKPPFLKDQSAFNGVQELLQQKGFYLNKGKLAWQNPET